MGVCSTLPNLSSRGLISIACLPLYETRAPGQLPGHKDAATTTGDRQSRKLANFLVSFSTFETLVSTFDCLSFVLSSSSPVKSFQYHLPRAPHQRRIPFAFEAAVFLLNLPAV